MAGTMAAMMAATMAATMLAIMAATTARGRRCGSLNPKCGKHLVVGIPLVPEGNCECFLCHDSPTASDTRENASDDSNE